MPLITTTPYATIPTNFTLDNLSFVQSTIIDPPVNDAWGMYFKPDGLKMYATDQPSLGNVYEYSLSSAWDVSTLLPSGSPHPNIATTFKPYDVAFKPDGLKMYVVGRNVDKIHEYNLSSAWDVSSATFFQDLNVAASSGDPINLFIRTDGLKMYISSINTGQIHEWNLSSAWDISSGTHLQSYNPPSPNTLPAGLTFNPAGTKLLTTSGSNNGLYEYNLGTAWDITSTSFVQSNFPGQDSNPAQLQLKPEGDKLIVLGRNSRQVMEYNLT